MGDIFLLPKITTAPNGSDLIENFKVLSEVINLQNLLCKVNGCSKELPLQYIRSHIAKHRFLGDIIPHVYGFCCILHPGNVRKITTRGKDFKPIVDCQYFYKFSYAAVMKNTLSNPLSNIPDCCPCCGCCVWTYEMMLNYQDKHNGVPFPFIITDIEIDLCKKFKY